MVDEAHVYTAPLIIGGREGRGGCAGQGVARLLDAIPARNVRRRVLGQDELTVARLTDAPLAG
jgi:riboflavin biosynthesis pyrimidine reductase